MKTGEEVRYPRSLRTCLSFVTLGTTSPVYTKLKLFQSWIALSTEYFIHEVKTKRSDIISVNALLCKKRMKNSPFCIILVNDFIVIKSISLDYKLFLGYLYRLLIVNNFLYMLIYFQSIEASF